MKTMIEQAIMNNNNNIDFKDTAHENSATKPIGDLTARSLAYPKDTNIYGDIFGGWVLSLMDNASYLCIRKIAPQHRYATVAANNINFYKPILVGDVVSCYTKISKMGRTSATITIEVWSERVDGVEFLKVASGDFVFVAMDDHGKPTPIHA